DGGVEVVGLDQHGHVPVGHRDHREIVETAAEEVAVYRGGGRRLATQQMGEEVHAVDAIRLEDADVRARPLEPGEAAAGVAYDADATRAERQPQRRRDGMKAEDVPDLDDALRAVGGGDESSTLVGIHREGLFDETMAARGEAHRRHREETV